MGQFVPQTNFRLDENSVLRRIIGKNSSMADSFVSNSWRRAGRRMNGRRILHYK